jgi:hypothetical protein
MAVAAFAVVQGVAADVGLGRRPGETLDEYRARLRESVSLSDGHLDLVAGLAQLALYSDRSILAEEAAAAAAATKLVRKDLRRSVGLGRTVLGAIRVGRPGPLR